jgi:hypothetical protein
VIDQDISSKCISAYLYAYNIDQFGKYVAPEPPQANQVKISSAELKGHVEIYDMMSSTHRNILVYLSFEVLKLSKATINTGNLLLHDFDPKTIPVPQNLVKNGGSVYEIAGDYLKDITLAMAKLHNDHNSHKGTADTDDIFIDPESDFTEVRFSFYLSMYKTITTQLKIDRKDGKRNDYTNLLYKFYKLHKAFLILLISPQNLIAFHNDVLTVSFKNDGDINPQVFKKFKEDMKGKVDLLTELFNYTYSASLRDELMEYLDLNNLPRDEFSYLLPLQQN